MQYTHLRAEPAKQLLVDFALNLMGRMGFPLVILCLFGSGYLAAIGSEGFVEEIIAG